jgi:predicted transcriptional regulator
MRTTLDIDDEVLAAAKALAKRSRRTAGQVISELVRQALTHSPAPQAAEPEARYGFRPFAPRGAIVTDEAIDRLRDDEGI